MDAAVTEPSPNVRRVARGSRPVRSLPGTLVRDRRAALCQLTHDELVALYAANVAKRTHLSDTALIDLLIWQRAGRAIG